MRKISTALALATTARAFANTPAAKRVEPVLTGAATGIAMPARSNKRGSVSLYPFDTLTEVGMAFGVKNKTAENLSSIVSNANRKAMVPATDEAGNPVYNTKELIGADGAKTVVPDTASPKMVTGKHFFAHNVDADYAKNLKGTALEGSTAVVFRDK